MCGPFVRDLAQVPQAFLEQIQAQQAALAKQQIHPVPADFDFSFNADAPLDSDLPFNLSKVYTQNDLPSLPIPDVDVSALFNWSLLEEPFSTPAPAAPSAASSPEDFCYPQDFNFDFSLGVSEVAEVKTEPAEKPLPEIGAKPPADKKRAISKLKPPKPLASLKSDSDDILEIEENECKPYTEKLPKDLLDHPCAATLLSAGIRIKGRTREELLEVAERIKKRRRASASRCRARKATHVHHLEDENMELKNENMMLKRRIAELTGGTMNLDNYFANSQAVMQLTPPSFAF